MHKIRNFVIIAHIDTGKSTLADRFLELTHAVETRKMQDQFLDRMGLERERGITIKMQPVRMLWKPKHAESLSSVPAGHLPKVDNLESQKKNLEIRNSDLEIADVAYTLHLIDTPGHVDFSYEVSRSLAAVEGAILLVDATKGIQAQTLANLQLAKKEELTIIPAVNKIDAPHARTEEVRKEIATVLKIDPAAVHAVSAKEGTGVAELLEAVVREVPPPARHADAPLRALIFDSHYDDYRGVIAHVRLVDGSVRSNAKLQFLVTGAETSPIEVGIFTPDLAPTETLSSGEIGYIATGIKDPDAVRIGDTITSVAAAADVTALSGYREPQPVVFASVYPEDGDAFPTLRDGIGKLQLNDASFTAEPEESPALGRGFRCGFLGTLHIEIIVERLRREYDIPVIVTHPSVAVTVITDTGETRTAHNPNEIPQSRQRIEEPWVALEILVPPDELNGVLKVLQNIRAELGDTHTVSPRLLRLEAEAPLLDVIEDFADSLKSATQGFASFSWQRIGKRDGDLVVLESLVAHEKVEALSKIVPKDRAEREARALALRLKELLPKQLFAVAIQVSADGRIIARETIPAMRKDVTAKLYGGDFSRKKKLLQKQRKGKKRMEREGSVAIPPETFMKLLRKDDSG